MLVDGAAYQSPTLLGAVGFESKTLVALPLFFCVQQRCLIVKNVSGFLRPGQSEKEKGRGTCVDVLAFLFCFV